MLNFICAVEIEHLKIFPEQSYKDLEKNIKNITHFLYWQWLDLYNIAKTDDSVDRKYMNIIEKLLSTVQK